MSRRRRRRGVVNGSAGVSLRFKVVLVMAVAVVLMAALNAAVLLPVSQSFTELEEEEAGARSSSRTTCTRRR